MNYIVKSLLGLVLLGFLLSTPSYAVPQEPNQKECPVLGSPVNKRIYVDYKGKRIYFCCPPCIRKFNQDPEKYMKKMEEQGVALEQTPEAKK
jgi:YHS domain-containing protein